jgi:hypothetical protein
VGGTPGEREDGMSAKPVFACVTLLTLLGGPRLFAQLPTGNVLPPGPPPGYATMDGGATGLERMPPPGSSPYGGPPLAGGLPPPVLPMGPGGLPPGAVASPWACDGNTPNCCGPVGRDGPIGSEVYAGGGVNKIYGGGLYASNLQLGWEAIAGFRTLFYNAGGDAAWVVDLGVTYNYNDARQGAGSPPFDLFGTQVVLNHLHRTSFNFALGRDWWVYAPAYVGGDSGANIRFGLEVGGKYGTAHADMNDVDSPFTYVRKQDVLHGVYLGLHAGFEVPMGNWTFVTDLRGQWGATWSNVIPGQNNDIYDLSALLTFGVRF